MKTVSVEVFTACKRSSEEGKGRKCPVQKKKKKTGKRRNFLPAFLVILILVGRP